MKTATPPDSYRYCILRVSVRTGRNFSPARKVLSWTLPSLILRSLVRTKAPPLPGFTCWNSRIRKIVPSISMWLPLRNWLVEITTSRLVGRRRLLEPRRCQRVIPLKERPHLREEAAAEPADVVDH